MGNVFRFTVIGLVLLSVFSQKTVAQAIQACLDPNETYNDCGPACGDRTCANKTKNDVTCLRACVEGCFCRGGYVRNKSNRCIPSYMCVAIG